MPLVKAVHSINTTVTTLHGITPLEVVLGRPVNEISVLLAMRQAGHKHLPIEPDLQVQNAKDTSSRERVSSSIHKVIKRGQQIQARNYNKR